MNKVALRCEKESSAKFYYASKRLFFETKAVKVILYILAIIPIVITFIPQINVNENLSLACSLISFSLTIINEVSSSFMNEHKEKAILEQQMYESEITGSTFSKIEYDREATNEVQELAIRKGLPKMHKLEKYHIVNVPEGITDDYSYIYICRTNAATDRFLLSRIFYAYFFILIAIVAIFLSLAIVERDTSSYLTLLIGFYPLIIPIIKDCAACKKTMKTCAKLCADTDNYFADGDASVERLARFYYYIQNIEFQLLKERPAIFGIFNKIFSRHINILNSGVTDRFIEAIVELKGRSLMLKGAISQPKGKGLITKVEYDLEYLTKMEKKQAVKKATTKKTTKEVQENKTNEAVKKTTKSATVKKSPSAEPAKDVKKTTVKNAPTSKSDSTASKKTTTVKKTPASKSVK